MMNASTELKQRELKLTQTVLTVQDAHELEPHVSVKAIQKACRTRELQAKWHGRFWLFMREDFDKWLVEFMAK